MVDKFYTGIGSRKCPPPILSLIRKHASVLATEGYTLRSGGANGADTAFETGCDYVDGKKEIFLPWKDYNKNKSNLFNIPQEAFKIAKDIYGPRWNSVSGAVKKFMARNIQQVVGTNLNSPSEFVLCWTPDGCTTKEDRIKETGGTGQAIAFAYELGIPVFNLKQDEKRFLKYLREYLISRK